MRTLKILGFLLTYPTNRHKRLLAECRTFLEQENMLSNVTFKKIQHLIDELENQDLLDLQESYVELFDRTPSLSLHLFEHVHGDSRERGQAMVDLSDLYAQKGLSINSAETPDYLPMFLEYVSMLEANEVKENLGSVVTILSALDERLQNRQSAYAGILQSLIEITTKTPDAKIVQSYIQQNSGHALSPEQIDQEWEEHFAFENTNQTTGEAGDCPQAQEMLARMNLNQNERIGK